MKMLLMIALLAPAQDKPKEPEKKKGIEHTLKEDAMQASVVTVTSSGDLILFDGAITVPGVRPSIEECGEWMSLPANERPRRMKALREKAKGEAIDRRMNPRERHVYVRKAVASKRSCQAQFKRKCEEIRGRVPVASRKAAVVDAKKSIDALLAEAKIKANIQRYFDNVLQACKLSE